MRNFVVCFLIIMYVFFLFCFLFVYEIYVVGFGMKMRVGMRTVFFFSYPHNFVFVCFLFAKYALWILG